MAKKPIFITLDDALHEQVKSAAPTRKLTLQGAYDEALRKWLGEGSSTQDISQLRSKGDTISVSKEEIEWLGRLLKVIDERPNAGHASALGDSVSRIVQQTATGADAAIGKENSPPEKPARNRKDKPGSAKRA